MKTEICAKVVEDSMSPCGVRLTTMELAYPRFIHAEFMTHRVFSRNASSSRAIPVARSIDLVRSGPALPLHWGLNKPGMQATEELEGELRDQAKRLWMDAARQAANSAEKFLQLGLHKQVANRLLEPFLYISVIVTATEWINFFDLRAHVDAQPEIQSLAVKMKEAMAASQPRPVSAEINSSDGWHLPYISKSERDNLSDPVLLAKLSAARCARVSYLNHDGSVPNVEKDLALFERLVGSRPLHASPIEHQASPLSSPNSWSRNFRGWRQFRQQLEESNEEDRT